MRYFPANIANYAVAAASTNCHSCAGRNPAITFARQRLIDWIALARNEALWLDSRLRGNDESRELLLVRRRGDIVSRVYRFRLFALVLCSKIKPASGASCALGFGLGFLSPLRENYDTRKILRQHRAAANH